jgi:hypothetical protein
MAPSLVWKHFDKKENEKGVVIASMTVCKHCKKDVKQTGGNTTSLIYHLKHNHQLHHGILETERISVKRKADMTATELNDALAHIQAQQPGTSCPSQTNISSSKKQKTNHRPSFFTKKWSSSDPKQIRADLEIMKYLAMNSLPFNHVATRGFKEFMEYVNQNIIVKTPSTYSTSKLCLLYNHVKDSLFETFRIDFVNVQAISFTTDLWSSRAAEPYMAFTIHYISAEFVLKSYTLGCISFAGRHTGVNIAEQFDVVIGELGLSDDIRTTCVTDGGSNMLAAAKKSKWMNNRLACNDHLLHLAVIQSVKEVAEVENAVEQCKSLSKNTHKSVNNCERIRMACDASVNSSKPVTYRKIISPCPTRWNSQYMCITSILEMRSALESIRDSTDRKDEDLGKLIPTKHQFTLLEHVARVLGYAAAVSEVFSADKTVTAHLIPIAIFNMLDKIKKVRTENFPSYLKELVVKFINAFITEIEGRFPDFGTKKSNDIAMAHFFDPSYKGVLLNKVNALDEAGSRFDQIKRAIFQSNRSEAETISDNESLNCKPRTSPEPDAMDRLYLDWMNKEPTRISVEQSLTGVSHIEKEFEDYLKMAKPTKSSCILEWWKVNSSRLPSLSKLARSYLAIPASSSSSERMFSIAGNIINCRRTKLAPESVNKLVFIRDNIQKVKITKWNLKDQTEFDEEEDLFECEEECCINC